MSSGEAAYGAVAAAEPTEDQLAAELAAELRAAANGADAEAGAAQLAACVACIIVFFGLYGFYMESLTQGGAPVPELLILLVNTSVGAAVSRAALFYRCETPNYDAITMKFFGAISVSFLGSNFCAWRSLRYLTYPEQVMGKTVNSVPILIANACLGKYYSKLQYAGVALIVCGTSLFITQQAELAAEAQGETAEDASGYQLRGVGLLGVR